MLIKNFISYHLRLVRNGYMKVVKQRAVSENVEKRTFGAVGGNVISTDSVANKLQPP